jgi:leader peptidase (prepilin peptidase)/N-methyltransferase
VLQVTSTEIRHDFVKRRPLLPILIAGCGVLGLAIGSFLNVVIYRIPIHESIIKPRSACPSCHASILERDNVPIVSWLLLHGKCRSCSNPISVRYPLVEFTCAVLFVGVAAREGFNWDVPALLIFVAGLLALASIDLEKLILPRSIVYSTLAMLIIALVLDSGATHQWRRLLIAGLCAAVWFTGFFILNLVEPRYLGFGDVRFALVLGLGLGWLGIRYVILGFFAGNFLGAIIGLALIAIKKRTKDQPVPYGVYLSLGSALAIFAGPEILVHFQRFH